MKRYIKREDLLHTKRVQCVVCTKRSRLGEENLRMKGWLKTKSGFICPSCPE